MSKRGYRALLCVLLAGCDRETRHFSPAEESAGQQTAVYQENRWAVSEGQRLYSWFNCVGCHANGGGGIGPPFGDDKWLYGSSPADVFTSIVRGRPNGMPAFGQHVVEDDVWKLVAYVRSLGRLTPPDTWPARSDHLSEASPEGR